MTKTRHVFCDGGVVVMLSANDSRSDEELCEQAALTKTLGSRQTPVSAIGPGTALKKLLARIGITASPQCRCNKRAALMNARGPDWCEANIDTIVQWLREEAASRGLPFLDAAAKMLVRRAIRNARKEASRARPPGSQVHDQG